MIDRKRFLLLLVAVAIRAAFIPHPGHETDVDIFESWSDRGATHGVTAMYDRTLPGWLPDYPPAQLYLYTALGHVRAYTQTVSGSRTLELAIIKLPAIVADLLLGLLLFSILRAPLGAGRAYLAAAIYYLHPTTWHNSAVWGQTDSIYTLLVLGALVALTRDRILLAGVIAGIVAMTKFQSLIFLPILVVFVLPDVRRTLTLAGGMAAGAAALTIPFFLAGTGGQMLAAYRSAFRAFPVLSSNTFNLWWAIFGRDAAETSNAIRFLGVPYRTWGLTLFSAAMLAVLWRVWKDSRAWSTEAAAPASRDRSLLGLMTAAAVISLCFFMLPTQIHERYFYPFIVLALPWALTSRLAFAAYAFLSFFFFLNVLWPVPLDLRTYILFLKYPWITVLSAVALVVAFIPTVLLMLRARPGPGTSAEAAQRRGLGIDPA